MEANIEADDVTGRTPLWWAAENVNHAISRSLWNYKVNSDKRAGGHQGRLLRAMVSHHERRFHLLLDMGANIEAMYDGETLLIRASSYGRITLVWKLLHKGADIEVSDSKYGWSALSWAAFYGHEPVVRLLIKRGAQSKCWDKLGRTSMQLAAVRPYPAIVRLLQDIS
ncbi:ankyrin repeat-containing domain protein [Biscogniauxia mediterranea]|nr:ankyrin repeat-containing domain protein [Biscogniauxia mediterranea]